MLGEQSLTRTALILFFLTIVGSLGLITFLATEKRSYAVPNTSTGTEKLNGMERLTQGLRSLGGQEGPLIESPAPQRTAARAGRPSGIFPTTSGVSAGNTYELPCQAPTGFLRRIVEARKVGFRDGVVHFKGVDLDLGQAGSGRFYDTAHNGCCDTYCRVLASKGYYSCVGPTTVATQFERAYRAPEAPACPEFGRH
jgi:hypothetical protein